MDKNDIVAEYRELKDKYDKLCSFIARVEEGSSPIHDDYPVAELYQQKESMEKELEELKGRTKGDGSN